MKFEKTTLVEFDASKERERLTQAFKGPVRKKLLTMLARFEAGEFDVLATERFSWPREFGEFVHPVIASTLAAIALRQARLATCSQGLDTAGLDEKARSMYDMQGTSLTAAGLPFPQFRLVLEPEKQT